MYIYKKLICKAKMDDSEVNIMVGQEKNPVYYRILTKLYKF